MTKNRKTLIGFTGILILGIIAALGVSAFSSNAGLAAGAPQAAATPQATPAPANPQNPNNGFAQYRNLFIQNFASQLGVTVDKLKSALIAALTDTLNQIVKDGGLTQARATQIEQTFSNWVNGGFQGPAFGARGAFPGFRGGFGRGFMVNGVILNSFAKALNISEQTLMSDLQNGQTIADVATAQKLDINQVKQAVLADVKSQLDTAVKNNQMTQTMEDTYMQNLTSRLDSMVNQKWNIRPRFNNGGNNGTNNGARNRSRNGFFNGNTL